MGKAEASVMDEYTDTPESAVVSNLVDERISNRAEDSTEDNTENERIINFEEEVSYSFSRPVSMLYFGEEYKNIQSWTQLYIQAVKCLLDDYPLKFENLKGKNISSNGGRKRVDFSGVAGANMMVAPKPISDTLYVETNLSATDIVTKLKRLLELCNVDYEYLELHYVIEEQVYNEHAHEPDKADSKSDGAQSTLNPIRVNRVAFIKWMKKNGCSTTVDIFSYLSALGQCSKIAAESGIVNDNLLTITEVPALNAIKAALLQDIKFKALNSQQHNCFSAALGKYLDFRYSEQLKAEVETPAGDSLVKLIEENGILFIDHRDEGGCLWIIGGMELFDFVTSCSDKNVYFNYRESGGRITDGHAAWWTKDVLTDTKTIPETKPQAEVVSPPVSIGISSETIARYTTILREEFEDGFQPNRAIHKDRFKNYYTELYGEVLTESDECIVGILSKIGTMRDDRIFPKQDADQSNLIQKIITAINDAFASGASCVYREAVFNRYRHELADCLQIYNVDAMTELLLKNNKGSFFNRYGYFAMYQRQPDIRSNVICCMKESPVPLNYDALQEKLWYITLSKIKQILVTEKSIVQVDTETYFYAPNLPISADELKELIRLIEQELSYRSHITDVELMTLIQSNCPTVAINTEEYKTYGLRNALGYIMRNYFSFNGPIISQLGCKISIAEVYAEFCRDHEFVAVVDLRTLSSELNKPIYWEAVLDEAVRISKEELIRKDLVQFDVDAIDSVLEYICPGAYIPLKSVDLFLHFPAINVRWNSFVLESYVYGFSKKFQLIHVGFSDGDCCGAIVRRDSNIPDYHALVVDALAHSDSLRSNQAALQFIVDEGYQQRKHYAGLKQVMQEAKLLKEKL